ncbi:MAG: anti-sigma factor [Gemmatimonadota bacterium]
MNPHDWFIEHRVDYVACLLDPPEERTFEDHLPGCPECKAEVAAIEKDLRWLPMGVAPAKTRPGLNWRIARAVLGSPRAKSRPAWIPVAAAAVVALAVTAAWQTGLTKSRHLAADLGQTRARVAALEDSLSVMRQAARVLQARIEMDGHEGGLVIFADAISHRWRVVVHGLPRARAGEKYQFWFICSDGMVRGVELDPDPAKPTIVTLGMPDRGGAVLGAALSLEPLTNRTDVPKGKQLAHLML